MSILTPFFNLIKPAKTDGVKVSDFNANMDTIDTEMHRPPLTINGIEPDPTTRNTYVEKVPLADNLASDIAQINYGEFITRTSGGDSSKTLNLTVTPAERAEGVDPITATVDRDTFVSVVTTSGTVTLVFTSSWSADPADYGITVEGTPITGDVITVVYVKEDRGTITVATPDTFNATGWNLYDNNTGYARIVAYSTEYGYRIGGNYSLVDFSPTLTGERTGVSVVDGLFNVTENGYIFITGGDATTYIYPTWSDWSDEYAGTFQTYTVNTINLSEAMLNFSYGLCAVGDVRDEINLNVQRTIQRIGRVAYDVETLADLIEDNVPYIYDTNYIYYVLETPVSTSIEISGTYTVSDHGIEFFGGTSVPVYTETLYGENLKDKLRTDVVTLSEQTLTSAQRLQVRANLGLNIANNLTTTNSGYVLDARQGKTLKDGLDGKLDIVTLSSVSANGNRTYNVSSTARIILVAIGGSTSKNIFIVNSASGTVSAVGLNSNSVISADTSTASKIKLVNTGANGAAVYALEISGTITD